MAKLRAEGYYTLIKNLIYRPLLKDKYWKRCYSVYRMLFEEIGRIVRINHTYVNHTYTYVPIYHQASSSLLSTDFQTET